MCGQSGSQAMEAIASQNGIGANNNCKNCGHNVSPKATHCPSCNYSFAPRTPCKNCGALLSADEVYTHKGISVRWDQASRQQQACPECGEPKPFGGGLDMFWGSIGVALGLALILIMVIGAQG